MKVILFGATGMIGQGVLRECLLDPEVERVVSVARRATGKSDPKLKEIVHADFFDLSAISSQLGGHDACLFCLGKSSAGMKEAEYRRVTYDITLTAARALAKRKPGMRFLYVSGGGTDSTERGRAMWARVKGATENALLALTLDAYMIRPSLIQPLHGIKASDRMTRVLYSLLGPLFPVGRALLPRYFTTTDELSKAMLAVAKHGADHKIIENHELKTLVAAAAGARAKA